MNRPFNFYEFNIEGHVFKFVNKSKTDMICKYCNFFYYDFVQREAGFPKCISRNEQIIKDLLE